MQLASEPSWDTASQKSNRGPQSPHNGRRLNELVTVVVFAPRPVLSRTVGGRMDQQLAALAGGDL